MTLSSTTTKVTYNGDGSTLVFPVTFKFLQNSHVKVILRDENAAPVTETTWVEGTHYTLTGAKNENGGSLTVKTIPTDYTPALGEKLTIKRDIPETQETDLPLGGVFPSASVEEALDQLTMLVQQHSEEIARTLLLPETSQVTGLTLPDPEPNKILTWNGAGNSLQNSTPTDLSLTLVSSYIETLLDDVDAATARTTLGIIEFTQAEFNRVKTGARLSLWNLTQ